MGWGASPGTESVTYLLGLKADLRSVDQWHFVGLIWGQFTVSAVSCSHLIQMFFVPSLFAPAASAAGGPLSCRNTAISTLSLLCQPYCHKTHITVTQQSPFINPWWNTSFSFVRLYSGFPPPPKWHVLKRPIRLF